MNQLHDGLLAIAMMAIAVVVGWIAATLLYRRVEVPSRNLKL
jgi:hypothetical protein